MASGAKRRFDSVSIREEWGVADATGFHLYRTHRYAPAGFPFSVCRIDGRQVAVFMDTAVPVEARAGLASGKPDWLDAMVCASVISVRHAALANVEAQVLPPDDADLEIWAFATAFVAVAVGLGLFKVEPDRYSIRFEARASVLVSMEFDDHSESWFGAAAVGSPMR